MEEEDQQRYQKQLQKRYSEALKRAQLEQRKAEIVKRLLDAKAYERLTNIKASNYELYSQLVDLLIAFAQQNRVQGTVSEAQLKSLLEKLTYKKETTIEFHHK
jgi:programmed cell death protein 5